MIPMGDRYLRTVIARCGDCAGEWTFHNPDLALYRDWVKAHLQIDGKQHAVGPDATPTAVRRVHRRGRRCALYV